MTVTMIMIMIEVKVIKELFLGERLSYGRLRLSLSLRDLV